MELVPSAIVSLKNMEVVVDLKVCTWKMLPGKMDFASLFPGCVLGLLRLSEVFASITEHNCADRG
jgi:hypothetical protein